MELHQEMTALSKCRAELNFPHKEVNGEKKRPVARNRKITVHSTKSKCERKWRLTERTLG